MSLVAYGTSDESSEDEGNEVPGEDEVVKAENTSIVEQTNGKLSLPAPKCGGSDIGNESSSEEESDKIHFEKLPKPKSTEPIEDENDDLPRRVFEVEKPVKKERAPVKITVPCLSEFKDIEEESEKKKNKIMPSKKGTGLFALLPPPKTVEMKNRNMLIPQVVAKKVDKSQTQTQEIERNLGDKTNSLIVQSTSNQILKQKSLELSKYESNSEDEDDVNTQSNDKPTTDFFALTTNEVLPNPVISDLNSIELKNKFNDVPVNQIDSESENAKGYLATEECSDNLQKVLVSNVMNLPKEEILLKNKAAVGPKLPVPEQEYNVDPEGNVAFDEKAIEYLCGKRGIKRKNKEIDEANIIEINGEDIKPDEREWLVKALTEEPIQRPVSIGAGVNSQSKKKHQITYLAHQAKAMEIELKNQWAQNRMTRKQTQSKYGF